MRSRHGFADAELMAESGSPRVRRVTVPVSLRGCSPDHHHFLPVCQIELVGEAASPIDYEGRRYLFAYTLAAGSYGADANHQIYVFVEPERPD
jgi:hypothetical protein